MGKAGRSGGAAGPSSRANRLGSPKSEAEGFTGRGLSVPREYFLEAERVAVGPRPAHGGVRGASFPHRFLSRRPGTSALQGDACAHAECAVAFGGLRMLKHFGYMLA
jgi:hypothetical protein